LLVFDFHPLEKNRDLFEEESVNESAEVFFTEVRKAFQFLEQQYSYKRLEESIEHPGEPRDTAVKCTYLGSYVGVEIWWYFAGAIIGVVFIELRQVSVLPEKSSPFHLTDPNVARAISLYDLAEVRGGRDDPNFLLKDVDNWRRLKKRSTQIETQKQEIIAGLARATQTYATDILQGDTSIFSEVMDYRLAKEKRLNPRLYIPGLKQQDESN
jgi:hypothetical protein